MEARNLCPTIYTHTHTHIHIVLGEIETQKSTIFLEKDKKLPFSVAFQKELCSVY